MKFDTNNKKLTKMHRAAALYTQGSSLRQAASAIGVSYSGLRKWLVAHNIARRPKGRPLQVTRQQIRDLIRAHQQDHKSLRELAKESGLDRGAIATAIKRAGFMVYTAKQMRSLLQGRRDKQYAEKILEMKEAGYPVREIAAHLHIDTRRIRRVVRGGTDAKN